MADGIDYDGAEGVVRITLSGAFCVEDFRRAMDEVVRLRESVGPTHALWDVTELDFSRIDIEVLRRSSELRAGYAPRRGGERVAVLVAGPIEQSIMELYLDLAEDPDTLQRVFLDREAAELWCRTGESPA